MAIVYQFEYKAQCMYAVQNGQYNNNAMLWIDMQFQSKFQHQNFRNTVKCHGLVSLLATIQHSNFTEFRDYVLQNYGPNYPVKIPCPCLCLCFIKYRVQSQKRTPSLQ